MSVSGTIAATIIDTSIVLEHALRRAGVKTALQTPEIVELATDNLYLLLVSLANAGINLWCVEKDLIGLQQGQATYQMPPGTIDVLNVMYSQPTQITGTDTVNSNNIQTDLGAGVTSQVVRAGINFSSVTAADTLVLSSSPDGVVWTAAGSLNATQFATNGFVPGTWYWVYADPVPNVRFWKLSTTNAMTASATYLASSVRDLPMEIFNRDTYFAQPNKNQQGRPCVNYFLEKLLNYQITLWLVPNNSADHLLVQVHRQIQDIGSLSQQLAIPQRWYNGIIWELAKILCFELPKELIDPQTKQDVIAEAGNQVSLAELGETDGSPLRLAPVIRGYTR